MKEARFIYDISEKNADLYYATKFKCPDAFIFFEVRGKKYMVLSDLELGRGKREAKVDNVLSLSEYTKRVAKKIKSPTTVDILNEIFKDYKIKHLTVPAGTSFVLVDGLRKRGYKIACGSSPFYMERFSKTKEELRLMTEAQRTVFNSISLARDVLRASKINGRKLIYKGQTLTSERLRAMINIYLLGKNFIAADTIVSCGLHAIDPHDVGSGALMANEAIIVDVFPRSIDTFYCGDATRTFCRGRASENLKRMYAVVKKGQEMGIAKIKDGMNGRLVHESIVKLFDDNGFKTGDLDGRKQGFIHGTGHGIGLEIHEEPARINPRDYILKKGNVVSVEPGLYYKKIGGVRIEDLVYVTKSGCEILGHFPKQLEI